MKTLMLATLHETEAVENAAQNAGEKTIDGVGQGLQFGGRFLLANLLWWVRGGLVALTVVLVVVALVRTSQKKGKVSWTAAIVVGILALLSHVIFSAVNPL